MKKAIVYSESARASAVFQDILRNMEYDEVELNDRIAFCGADEAASLQLINAGLSFDAATKLAEKLTEATGAAVLLLANSDDAPERCDQLRSAGVLVAEKPLSKQLFMQAVRDAESLRGRIRRMAELLHETRRIDRAKLLLIGVRGMSEEEAHKYIERQAMNRRITRLEVANELIASIRQ